MGTILQYHIKNESNAIRAIEQFYRHFGAVDQHDHLRQGSLEVEHLWCTKTWWHRLFGSILGMIVTDAYLAYKFEQ